MQDIQISTEGAIVRVTYRGQAEYGAITEMLRNVAQIAAERKVTAVLFDIRVTDYRNYAVETIRHAEEGPALGIDKNCRFAFVGAHDNPMLKFIEDVSVNRGYRVKVFTDETGALDWLRQAR